MLLWRGLSLLCTVEGGASAVPKPSCIQFSILKNACQPQLLSLKIGKKVSKSENQKHWKIIFRFLWLFGKNPCSGPYFGLLFNIMWNVPHEIFLAVQDSSHWLTYSFSLWVVFISPSWGQNCTSLPHHLDFGIFLGCSFASWIDPNFIGLVTSWRHSICQIVKQYFIRWDIFKTELQVWFEECPIVQDCGRPWELSGCPLLLFLISNDIVTEARLALDCDIQPWDNRWIKNGWGNCLKKLSKHYSGGLRWNFDSGPVGGDGCPLHLPPTLPWTKLCTGPKYQNVQRSHHKVPGTGHCTTVTLREGSGYQIG